MIGVSFYSANGFIIWVPAPGCILDVINGRDYGCSGGTGAQIR